jgi:hypothetical protein
VGIGTAREFHGHPQRDAEAKDCPMKLTSAQVERTLRQFDAQAIPDDHPVVDQLHSLFGEHTFFLDSHGLNVLEPAEPPRAGSRAGKVVSLAHWSDADPTSLEPLDHPEPTDVVVEIEATH